MRNRLILTAALAAFTAAGIGSANAALITSQAALGANDFVSWGQLGGSGTTLPTPVPVVSNGGLNATVTSIGGVVERLDQLPGGGGGWDGNFTSGDQILWDQGAGPNITITFAHPVSGFGAQIQADIFGAFTAQITLSNGDVWTEIGDSNNNEDGSAIFIGALDGTADITSVTFDLTQAFANPEDFAIDTLFLNTNLVNSVPEPLTLSLFGAGLAGTIALRRRRKSRS